MKTPMESWNSKTMRPGKMATLFFFFLVVVVLVFFISALLLINCQSSLFEMHLVVINRTQSLLCVQPFDLCVLCLNCSLLVISCQEI